MRINVANDGNLQNLARKDSEKIATAALQQKPTANSNQKRYMLVLRCSVICCIMLVAGCIGYFAYYVVRSSETKQSKDAYKDLIRQLLPAANTGIWKSAAGVYNTVSVLTALYPNASTWPNVAAPGFPLMARIGSSLSGAAGMGVAPIVLPHQVADFEAFAYNYYAQDPQLYQTYPGSLPPGESSFGRGISTINFSLVDVPDYKYHDTKGNTTWPTTAKFEFLAPNLQFDGAGTTQRILQMILMVNSRTFEQVIQETQDKILECVANRGDGNDACSMVSGIKEFNPIFRTLPHIYTVQPVIALDEPDKVVAFAYAAVFFDQLLNDLIPAGTNGIDFVVQSDTRYFSYRIHHGMPMYHGETDEHDTKYDDWKETVDLTIDCASPGTPDQDAQRSRAYTISFYPNDAYMDGFRTELRWIFCFGSMVLIMLVCVIFATYDHFMVRENTEQQAVLDTKRQFVRFISHEVRTPLNAVAMAGDLMRDQLLDLIKVMHKDLSSTTLSRTSSVDIGQLNASIEVTMGDSLELCKEIVANTKKAVEVLDDLLNYDKIEVGGLTLDLSFVALECTVESVMKPFRGPAKQKNVLLEANIHQYLRSAVFQSPRLFGGKFCALRVVADKIRIEQVIRNLVSNAIKFTSSMGKITVTLEWIEGAQAHSSPSQVKHILSPAAVSPSVTKRTERTERTQIARSAEVDADIEASTGLAAYDGGGTRSSGGPNTRDSVDSEAEEVSRQAILKAATGRTPNTHSTHRWGSVRLSVADDGAGLTPEQLRVVCSQGVQFNANELQAGQGSGLGLFIAKGIVKQHGGLMTVTSEGLHKGSTFIVELPVYACDLFHPDESAVLEQAKRNPEMFAKYGVFGAGGVQRVRSSLVDLESLGMRTAEENYVLSLASASGADGELVRGAERGAEDGEDGFKKPMHHVLVVDDVESNRKMAIRLLQRSGVEVCEQAVDGQQAIEVYINARQRAFEDELEDYQRARAVEAQAAAMGERMLIVPPPEPALHSTEPFDAILMDFEMPIMNGPCATTKLRELGCRAMIVGITGNVLRADIDKFLSHGATAVLPKPLKFAELEKIWQVNARNDGTIVL